MGVKLRDRPKLIYGQYIDHISEYEFYYNPYGYGGVTVVDKDSQNLINLCNGENTIGQIIKICNRPKSAILDEIRCLARQDLITISDEHTADLKKSRLRRGVLSCWLHVTNNCNLACSYCYIHKCPGDMDIETGKLAVDKMIESCLKHNRSGIDIKFAGGEPLLRFSFIKEIVDYSQQFKDQLNIHYSIITNGTLITRQIAEYLKLYNMSIGVSLDGIGSVNDVNRFYKNGRGSFNNVIKGLQLLKMADNKITVMTTVSVANYHNLIELTKFLIENDYNFRFSMQKDCDSGYPELLKHNSDLIKCLDQVYDYIESNLPTRNFFEMHKFCDVNFLMPIKRCCGAGNSFFAIGHDGKIGLCGMGLAKPFLNTDISKAGDIIDGIRAYSYPLENNAARNYPTCNQCIWKNSCAGGCPLQTKSTYGVYEKPTPYCEVHKKILPRILRIKAMQMIRDNK